MGANVTTQSPITIPSITGNPQVDSLIRSLLIAGSAGATTCIVSKLNITDQNISLAIGGVVLGLMITLSTTVWGFIQAKLSKKAVVTASVVGVQSGVNLTVSGHALAADGKTVVEKNDGSTPPLPVTVQTAAEIIKNFGPPVP